MMDTVLAVDVGGTTLKGTVVGADGTTRLVRSVPTHGGPTVLDALLSLLSELAAQAKAGGWSVVAAGVVTPGLVDRDSGRVLYASNLGWRDLDLRDRVASHLGVPVAVDHDVRATGVAEALLGAARGADDFVLMPVGTGIAAALVTGGRIIRGVGNAAGEVGHMPVHPRGELCACGQRGCLEAYGSASAVASRYAALSGRSGMSAEDVVAAASTDPLADRVWSEAVEALALGVTTITLTLDPGLIVIGGGLAQAGDALLHPLRSSVVDLLAWRSPPRIERSTLGSSAGHLGAAIEGFRCVGRAAETEAWLSDS